MHRFHRHHYRLYFSILILKSFEPNKQTSRKIRLINQLRTKHLRPVYKLNNVVQPGNHSHNSFIPSFNRPRDIISMVGRLDGYQVGVITIKLISLVISSRYSRSAETRILDYYKSPVITGLGARVCAVGRHHERLYER